MNKTEPSFADPSLKRKAGQTLIPYNSYLSDKDLVETLAIMIDDRVADEKVIDILHRENSNLVNYESELWDYKTKLTGGTNEALTFARTVKQIVSFYNTFGGYLIYGVSDDGELVGDPPAIDKDQLEQKCIRYIGHRVYLVMNTFEVNYGAQKPVTLTVLCVPKRSKETPPVEFIRHGPNDAKGSPVFAAEDVYFRERSSCMPCRRQDDYAFLFGDRDVEKKISSSGRPDSRQSLFNTLPDKGQICSEFIGRSVILIRLWKWLRDDFSFIKVLTGIGGNGKSSIAYEFALSVCKEQPLEFENVFWLTAKTKRYLGNTGRMDSVIETHFKDLDSLIESLADGLAIPPDAIEGTVLSHKRNLLKQALTEYPCFIVVDDIDSLPSFPKQRELIDFIMQVASGTKSRFLLTTRQDVLGSGETYNIEVPGLSMEDYKPFVAELLNRARRKRSDFGTKFSTLQLKRLLKVLDGSPLYTEDFVRQLLTGLNFDNALKKWQNEAGDDVRRATLEKETDMLGDHAKRILYALCLMGEASAAELQEVTGCQQSMFAQCLDQLDALFLLHAPPITDTEKRFRVKTNTSLLVLSSNNAFVQDAATIATNVKRLNKRLSNKGGATMRDVGNAINQANAQMRQGRPDDALETIQAMHKRYKNNRNLFLMQARVLLSFEPPNYSDARIAIQNAYDLNQGKRELFHIWYDLENECANPEAMIDVASNAIDRLADDSMVEWYIKRAEAKVYSAKILFDRRSSRSVKLYLAALDDFLEAKSRAVDSHATGTILENIGVLALHFVEATRRFNEFEQQMMANDFWQQLIIAHPDYISAANQCIENLQNIWRHTENPSEKTCNLIDAETNKMLENLRRKEQVENKTPLDNIISVISKLSDAVDNTREKLNTPLSSES